MKLEAMKRQGKRTDLTSVQVAQKLSGKTSREILAGEVGESQDQVRRYIRLTYLIPELLQRVDEGKMAMTPAVELHTFQKSYSERFSMLWNKRTVHRPTHRPRKCENCSKVGIFRRIPFCQSCKRKSQIKRRKSHCTRIKFQNTFQRACRLAGGRHISSKHWSITQSKGKAAGESAQRGGKINA